MHQKFLLAALESAKKGRGACAPNPCVGAVAVQNNKIIAQAWHQGVGLPHAEQLLLTQIALNTPGVSVYITLEPCNHWGRTPPCVDTIINAGIDEVIFSYLDPNPIVAGNNSSEKLRQHGIKVTHFPLPEIDEFYKSYTQWTLTGKPRVTVKMALSLDGKIADLESQRVQLSNSLCEEFTHEHRAAADVLLTSAKTILKDNPNFNVRLKERIDETRPVAIIDTHCSLHSELNIFSKASHCLIYHIGSKTPNPEYPNSSFYTMPIKNGKMDIASVIDHLGECGYHDLWVEVGSDLFTSLHREGLVDRTYLYIVPKILGQNALTAFQNTKLFDRAHSVSWHEMGDNMIACLDWQEVEDECIRR